MTKTNGKYSGDARQIIALNTSEAVEEAPIPQSIDSEKALLGSILLDPEVYVLVSDIVRPDDFYRDAHRRLYRVIEYLVEHGETPDIVSICEELERRNIRLWHDEANEWYLSKLLACVPTANNAETYARTIEDRSVRRALLGGAGAIANAAQTETAEGALATAEDIVFSVSQKRNVSNYVPVSEVMARCQERIAIAQRLKAALLGLATGFKDLDRILEGLRKEFLYILAARPGMGKTSLALAIAYAAAKMGKKVAFYSLEMGDEELGFRLIAERAGVPSDRLQKGIFNNDERGRIEEVMSVISESNLFIDETGNLSISQLRNRCRLIKAKEGLDFIIVDYLQLLHAVKHDGKSHENRVQEIGEISRGLKLLAKELDVPVLALSQLSRAVETRSSKVPQLSDLRESGDIEADADVVMFIYRDEVYNAKSDRKGQADVIVAKNRHGAMGDVTLTFVPELTRFANLEVTPEW